MALFNPQVSWGFAFTLWRQRPGQCTSHWATAQQHCQLPELCPGQTKPHCPGGTGKRNMKNRCAELLKCQGSSDTPCPCSCREKLPLLLWQQKFSQELGEKSEEGSSIHLLWPVQHRDFVLSLTVLPTALGHDKPWSQGKHLIPDWHLDNEERCSQQQQDCKHFSLHQNQKECSQTPNSCEYLNNRGQDLVSQRETFSTEFPMRGPLLL